MLSRKIRAAIVAAAIVLPVASVSTACGAQKNGPTVLRQIKPGSTWYIDAWNDDKGKKNKNVGDQAQVEQKPSGLWILNLDAAIKKTRTSSNQVKVTLDKKRGFVILDMGTTQVGKDHDDCLAADGETYAQMDVKLSSLKWEKNKGGSGDGDCVA